MEAADKLISFLAHYRKRGPLPILWVGAGASAAAGYPTLPRLEALLREELGGSSASGFDLFDDYVRAFSENDLVNALETHLGAPRKPVPLHDHISRLGGAGVFRAIFTTNYDRLIEDALRAQNVAHVHQTLESNYALQERTELLLLKLHGDRGDWRKVVLVRESYEQFQHGFPRLFHQLDRSLRAHPIVFVGCSMRDPRLLDWLRALPPEDRCRALFACRVVITRSDWAAIPGDEREILTSANIQPIEVDDHVAIAQLFGHVARKLAPLAATDLTFDITPGPTEWVVTGPTSESPAHTAANPLRDEAFVRDLVRLRALASTSISLGDAQAPAREEEMLNVARNVGARLTSVLLSSLAYAAVAHRIHQVDLGRARLTVRVADAGPDGDRALALPWELLMPEPPAFAVRQGQLDLVRDALVPSAPSLAAPIEGISVAVTIAAPEDRAALRYEEEAYRIHRSLAPLGHGVAFTELGGDEDFVDLAARLGPTALHFSGHGLPGALLFEDEFGLSKEVPIADLVAKINTRILGSAARRPFPRLFFLASCHGASTSATSGRSGTHSGAEHDDHSRDLGVALGEGPSAAAALHRCGFTQVLGYFGPVSDALCTRAETLVYEAIARGETTLQAATLARRSLDEVLDLGVGAKLRFPLGWMLLAVYHRGPNHPLALAAASSSPSRALTRLDRRFVQVSGLPVLEFGFIGRRALQHDIRRRVRDGQTLLVLHGLGGLGKTALASQLLRNAFAPGEGDALVLQCDKLDASGGDPIEALWLQVREHGRRYWRGGDWDERMVALSGSVADRARWLEEAIRLLRDQRPQMVVYADNTETLQSPPAEREDETAGRIGAWSPSARSWWDAMERLSQGGLVMVSTRYGWEGLDPRASIALDPMREPDSLRMIEWFPELQQLPRSAKKELATRVDGHPQTVAHLAHLIRMARIGRGAGYTPTDSWTELVAPMLAAHDVKITADLLLPEIWRRVGEAARTHAARVSVLRRPAPREVIDRADLTGGATATLIDAGLLTRFREQIKEDSATTWVDRWAMHSIVHTFVVRTAVDLDAQAAHRLIGIAYDEWKGKRLGDYAEAVHHLLEAREGDRVWDTLHFYTGFLRRATQYDREMSLLQRCVNAGPTGDRLASVHLQIAQVAAERSRRWTEEARAAVREAARHAESTHLRACIALTTVQWTTDLAETPETEAQIREYLEMPEMIDDRDRPPVLLLLALTQARLGKRDDAVRTVESALPLITRKCGNHYSRLLARAAEIMITCGRVEEAETILRTSRASIGLDGDNLLNMDVVGWRATMTLLGTILNARGEFEGATDLLYPALGYFNDSLDDPGYDETLTMCVDAYLKQGKHEHAMSTLVKSIVRAEKVDPHFPLLAKWHERVAKIAFDHEDYKTAGAFLGKVIVDAEPRTQNSAEFASLLHRFAFILAKQGNLTMAESFFRNALVIYEATLGADHPRLASTLASLGSILKDRGAPADGEPFVRRAYALALTAHGPDHEKTREMGALLDHIRTASLWERFNEGTAALKSKDVERAIDLLSGVATEAAGGYAASVEGSAHAMLGQALCLVGRRVEGIVALRRAIDLAQGSEENDVAEQLLGVVDRTLVAMDLDAVFEAGPFAISRLAEIVPRYLGRVDSSKMLEQVSERPPPSSPEESEALSNLLFTCSSAALMVELQILEQPDADLERKTRAVVGCGRYLVYDVFVPKDRKAEELLAALSGVGDPRERLFLSLVAWVVTIDKVLSLVEQEPWTDALVDYVELFGEAVNHALSGLSLDDTDWARMGMVLYGPFRPTRLFFELATFYERRGEFDHAEECMRYSVGAENVEKRIQRHAWVPGVISAFGEPWGHDRAAWAHAAPIYRAWLARGAVGRVRVSAHGARSVIDVGSALAVPVDVEPVLARLALARAPCERELVERIVGATDVERPGVWDSLERAGAVLHCGDLVAAHPAVIAAHGTTEPDGETVERFLQWIECTCERWTRVMHLDPSVLPKIAAHEPLLLSALDAARSRGQHARTIRTLGPLVRLLDHVDRGVEARALVREYVHDCPATFTGEAGLIAARMDAERLLEEGEHVAGNAGLEAAIETFDQQKGDPVDLALLLGVQGRWQGRVGLPDAGLRLLARALDSLTDVKSDAAAFARRRILADLAGTCERLGRLREAEASVAEALEIARGTGDSYGVAVALVRQASLARVRGDWSGAAGYCKDAAALTTVLNARALEGSLLLLYGDVLLEVGAPVVARGRFARSYHLQRIAGDAEAAGEAAGGLGQVAMALGEPAQARGWFDRMLDIARETGSRELQIAALTNRAMVLEDEGLVREAVADQRAALQLGEGTMARRELAVLLSNMALCLAKAEEFEEAEAAALRAIQIWRDLESPEVWRTYGVLSQIAGARGDEVTRAEWQNRQDAARSAAGKLSEVARYQGLVEALKPAFQWAVAVRSGRSAWAGDPLADAPENVPCLSILREHLWTLAQPRSAMPAIPAEVPDVIASLLRSAWEAS